MKKVISVVLSLVMIFALTVPAFSAQESKSQYPIVTIRGNGNNIFDENGKQVYDFQYDTSNLADDVVEVCMPHLIEGLATGDYSNYFDALYKKLAEVYGDAKLDVNGNPTGGTDIQKSDREYMETRRNLDMGASRGYYEMGDYKFWYDWRLDPLELADELNAYINDILDATGKKKVSLYGRCIGGTPILAYLSKYGSDKIDTVCLDSVVSNGGEMIGDVFTANLNLNSDAILRFVNGYWNENVKELTGDLLFDVIFTTFKLFNSTGVSEELINVFMNTVYSKLGAGFISAFTRAGYATWPSYWSMVKADEYEKAKTVIFGDEDCELRETYAGLIEKLDNYHDNVSAKIPEILQSAKDNGTKICIVCKYGYQLFPYVGSYDLVSDQWVSLKNSSFGATVAKINEVLPDEYIAEKTEAGLGKYISVDKIVDASTCLFPDNTWFVKGVNHDDWESCVEHISCMACASDGDFTVDSDENYPQFLCYSYDTSSISPLTTENMNCEEYYGFDTGSTETLTKKERIAKKLSVLFDWLKIIISLITGLFGGAEAPAA